MIPKREHKIEVMRMACDLDMNSDLTNFFCSKYWWWDWNCGRKES